MSKIDFTMHAELSRFASSIVTLRSYKAGGRSCATYIFPHDIPPLLHLLPYG
jgi:acyl-CoA hydrolase